MTETVPETGTINGWAWMRGNGLGNFGKTSKMNGDWGYISRALLDRDIACDRSAPDQ